VDVRLLGLALIALLVSPLLAGAQGQPPNQGASAQLYDQTGRLIATASFREATDQVLISLAFPDRTALTGTHGIQIHEIGRCDLPNFASAGGIFNPFGKQHGLLNTAGPMAGDLPSLVIGPAGVALYNTAAPLVKLSAGPTALLKPGGTSLVIFDKIDDDLTQPEGNAGTRVACGVIVAGAPVAGSAPQFSATASTSSQRSDVPVALLIGGLGALLIGAGLVLRRQQAR
jgi:Cu-Zn family superoxide dismutase